MPTNINMSELATGVDIDAIAASKLTGALPAISGASLTNLPGGGKVLQVVSNTDTSVYTISTSGSSYVAYNGINTSITPASTSNNVLIMVSLSIGADPSSYPNVQLYRDSTLLIQGDAASSRNRSTFSSSAGRYNTDLQTTTFVFLDTAISTTSSVTYKLQVNCGGVAVFYVNQTDFTGTDGSTGVSSMIIQEIGA